MKARCTGHRADGERCGRWPTRGATVCKKHGAGAPQVAAKAAVRAEVLEWGLGDVDIDPGQTLLKMISQSSVRVELYSGLLEEQYTKAEASGGDAETTLPARVGALIGREYQLNGEGRPVPVREAIRALVRLDGEERDRLARYCGLAVSAGLMARQVTAAEKLGGQLAEILKAVLGDPALNLSVEQQAAFPAAARRHLALTGASAIAGMEQDA